MITDAGPQLKVADGGQRVTLVRFYILANPLVAENLICHTVSSHKEQIKDSNKQILASPSYQSKILYSLDNIYIHLTRSLGRPHFLFCALSNSILFFGHVPLLANTNVTSTPPPPGYKQTGVL